MLNSKLHENVHSKKQMVKLKTEARSKVLNDYYDKLIEAGMDINQAKIERWMEKERKKINENFDDESRSISDSFNPQ